MPKYIDELTCVEALEVLREGLRHISDLGRLPEVSLLETYINRAITAHNEEVETSRNEN
jgi:hypothetical protein